MRLEWQMHKKDGQRSQTGYTYTKVTVEWDKKYFKRFEGKQFLKYFEITSGSTK